VAPSGGANLSWLVRFCTKCAAPHLASLGSRSTMAVSAFQGGRVLRNQVLNSAVHSNSALLTDASTSPLRAQHGAAKRGR
jgi:hypothetical protein